MGLEDQILQAKRRDQIKAWDEGERKLAATIAAPEVELSDELRSRLAPFYAFAEAKSVRRLPARPATVAAWIRFQAGLAVPTEQILAALLAIEAAHDQHSLANPVRTAIVRAELNTIVKVDPPRSWPKEAKATFALLPPDIQRVLAKRQMDFDKELSRLHEEVAKLRQRAEPQSAHIETEKDQTMTKRDDTCKPGQGIDGSKDEGFHTKNIDRKALREQFGSVADLTPKNPGKA